MSEDMSEIFQKMNDMLKNNEVPDSIKSMLNNFNSNGMSSNSSTEQPNSENNSNDMPNFDLYTMIKDKVDKYIKLFSMGKAFEILNPLGGEKKNDV